MEELEQIFGKLKISALTKYAQINSYVHDVTIGPEAAIEPKINTSQFIAAIEKCVGNKSESTVNENSSPSLKKIYLETELQRQQDVQKAVEKRVSLMQAETSRRQAECQMRWQLRQKELAERNKQHELSLKRELQAYEKNIQDEHDRMRRDLQIQEQERIRRTHELRVKEEEKLKNQDINTIEQIQSQFRITYEKFSDIYKSCLDKHAINKILYDHSKDLKSLPEEMDRVVELCKSASNRTGLIEAAKIVLEKVTDLNETINQEIETANHQFIKETENVKKTEPTIEKTQKTTNVDQTDSLQDNKTVNLIPENIAQTNDNNHTEEPNEFVSKKSLSTYVNLQQYRIQYEERYKNLLTDPSLKKYRFDLKRAVNIPVSAISATSSQHLTDKYKRLAKLLSGQTVEGVGSIQVSASQHPEGLAFCMDSIAKMFVLQGEVLDSNKADSVFAYAAVIVALWNDFPDFGKLILAHFYNECPYLVPMYKPQPKGQSNQDYYKSLGYKYIDGEVEKQDKFLKRMSGTVKLYAAILITKQKRDAVHIPHPHNLSNGWRWISCLLNLPPRPDISATVLLAFLETSGNLMLVTYGHQFRKIIKFIQKDYLPRLQEVDSGGPVGRLEMFLQNVTKRGLILPPQGMLPNNFW